MAQLTNTQVRSYIGSLLDIDVSSGDGPTLVLAAMNQGGRRVWEARSWFGREVTADLFTVAPYATGTVALAQAGTTVTGTGTTWVTGMTGRKIAIPGIGSPWYRFTYVSGTSGTIPTGGYAETTVTASTYSIFQDELDLATTAETIKGVWLYSSLYQGRMLSRTETQMDDNLVNPTTGVPATWAPVQSLTAGVRRLRVSPVPDAIYRLRVKYLSAFTDVAADSSTCVLGSNRERAWILASCLEAQRGGDAKAVTSEDEVQAAIEEAWIKEQAASPMIARRVPVGGRRGRGGFGYINDDGAP